MRVSSYSRDPGGNLLRNKQEIKITIFKIQLQDIIRAQGTIIMRRLTFKRLLHKY